jgi:hypothetical protein
MGDSGNASASWDGGDRPRLSTESRAILGSGFTSLYAMILVAVYLAFSFTDLVTFPRFHNYLETHGFFLYLYVVADIFLIYVLVFVILGKYGVGPASRRMVENHKVNSGYTIMIGSQ